MDIKKSHPAWVCGLKLGENMVTERHVMVTPCVGVWIETRTLQGICLREGGHTLRGCVD